MINFKEIIKTTLAASFFWYFVFAFVQNEIDPTVWTLEARGGHMAMSLCSSLLYLLIKNDR